LPQTNDHVFTIVPVSDALHADEETEKKSSENSEDLASNDQDSNSGEKDELGAHSHEDLPWTSSAVPVDPEEDLCAAPKAPLRTSARAHALRVYTRRPRSPSQDPPQAPDRARTSPTAHVGSSSAAPGFVGRDSEERDDSGENSDSSAESAAATSPTV
jgi:hypothetical protein